MVYLFKLYDLKELRDFNMFKALEMIGDEIGIYKSFQDWEDMDAYLLTEFNEGDGDFSEMIEQDTYIVIIDIMKETLVKKIYTLKLESKDATESVIQKLFDEQAAVNAKKAAELAALNEKINKK